MNITALSSQLQPVTNKRNSAMLGKAIEESLGVSPNRGIIRFIPIAEENYATDGKTLAGEMEEFERDRMDDPSALHRGLSRASGKGRKKSLKSLRKLKSNLHLHPRHEAITPPSSGRDASHMLPPLPPTPTTESFNERTAKRVQRMGRRKSFMATLLGK
jgi:uncharacterized protein (UPF0276 family)